jgi:hypothetical protein
VGKKLIHVRHISPASVRIGGKTGVNISRSGVSKSTRFGTINSKRGCSAPLGMLIILGMLAIGAVVFSHNGFAQATTNASYFAYAPVIRKALQATPQPTITPTPMPPAPTAAPVPTYQPTVSPPRVDCDPAYPTVCIPSPPPDLDCGDIPYRNFKVLPPDPHRFDGRDNDGIGCETQY